MLYLFPAEQLEGDRLSFPAAALSESSALHKGLYNNRRDARFFHVNKYLNAFEVSSNVVNGSEGSPEFRRDRIKMTCLLKCQNLIDMIPYAVLHIFYFCFVLIRRFGVTNNKIISWLPVATIIHSQINRIDHQSWLEKFFY